MPKGLVPFSPYLGLMSLGQQHQQPPAMAQSGGGGLLGRIGGAFGQLFGGAPNPMLSAEQNRAAQRQALIEAGLAAMLASGPSPVRPQLGQILATAALAGRQAGADVRQTMVQAATRQKIGEAIGSGDLEGLQRMFTEAVRVGDIDSARAIGTVIQSVAGMRNEAQRRVTQVVTLEDEQGKPQQVLIDRETGEVVSVLGAAPESSSMQEELEHQRRFNRENTLLDDYRTETKLLRDTYRNLSGAVRAVDLARAGNGAAQTQLLYAFIKMVDPTSVVREGELALIRGAADPYDNMKRTYNRIIQGEAALVPPELLEQVIGQVTAGASQIESEWADVYEDYQRRARSWNVNPDLFFGPPAVRQRQSSNNQGDALDRFGQE